MDACTIPDKKINKSNRVQSAVIYILSAFNFPEIIGVVLSV